jgi:hypothetical protein
MILIIPLMIRILINKFYLNINLFFIFNEFIFIIINRFKFFNS